MAQMVPERHAFHDVKAVARPTKLLEQSSAIAQDPPRVCIVLKYAIQLPRGAPDAHGGIAGPTRRHYGNQFKRGSDRPSLLRGSNG
jgi:hypothetical protein